MSHSKDRLSHKSRQTLLSVSIAACAAISLQITPQAFAAEQQYTIAVDSTPLGQALLAIARQSGKVIAFDPALVDSLKAKPITATVTIDMWASYQLSGGWSVGGGIDARSTIEARGLTREQPINAPGQARLDAMVRYDAKTWSSVLGVRNIADRRLYGDVINPVATYVEPERTFTLTTTVKF